MLLAVFQTEQLERDAGSCARARISCAFRMSSRSLAIRLLRGGHRSNWPAAARAAPNASRAFAAREPSRNVVSRWRLTPSLRSFMETILDPRHLTPHQARSIVQGMALVAAADGNDEREIILMREFWDACAPDVRQAESLDEVRSSPLDVAAALEALSSKRLKQMFLAACLLVAYADGRASAAEQATIAELIRHLDIDAETASATHDRVQSLLVDKLSRISDLATLRRISEQL